MTPFELLEPASLKDAIALIDPDDPTVRPIAGGTALMLMMKAGVFAAAPAHQPAARSSGGIDRHQSARRRAHHRRA